MGVSVLVEDGPGALQARRVHIEPDDRPGGTHHLREDDKAAGGPQPMSITLAPGRRPTRWNPSRTCGSRRRAELTKRSPSVVSTWVAK